MYIFNLQSLQSVVAYNYISVYISIHIYKTEIHVVAMLLLKNAFLVLHIVFLHFGVKCYLAINRWRDREIP